MNRMFCLLAVVGLLVGLSPGSRGEQKSSASADSARVATVLGKDITLDQIIPVEAVTRKKELADAAYQKWLLDSQANQLLSLICGPVMRRWTSQTPQEPTDAQITEQITALKKDFETAMKKDETTHQQFLTRMFWLEGSSKDWRTARTLYRKYGGRVGISAFGATTAIDGLNAVLKDSIAAGDLTFHDPRLEQAFWDRVRKNPFSDVVLPPNRAEEHFATPPWDQARLLLIKELGEKKTVQQKE